MGSYYGPVGLGKGSVLWAPMLYMACIYTNICKHMVSIGVQIRGHY